MSTHGKFQFRDKFVNFNANKNHFLHFLIKWV